MYDCTNIGSPVIVFVDAGGFGSIAYALHVEHPNIHNSIYIVLKQENN